jgi:hypothetical protein
MATKRTAPRRRTQTAPAAPVDIAQLLRDARAAHEQYRAHTPRMAAIGGQLVPVAGDAPAAGAALRDALRLRTEAHVLDPHHLDPAWRTEPVSYDHDQLLAFYVAQLAS